MLLDEFDEGGEGRLCQQAVLIQLTYKHKRTAVVGREMWIHNLQLLRANKFKEKKQQDAWFQTPNGCSKYCCTTWICTDLGMGLYQWAGLGLGIGHTEVWAALAAILYTFLTQSTPTHYRAHSSHGTLPVTAHPDWEKSFPTRNGCCARRQDCFLNPFMYRRTDSSGPPRANQGVSKAEPRDGHAVCTLQMHPSISPYPALSVETEPSPKGIAGSDITRWKFHAGYIQLHLGKG